MPYRKALVILMLTTIMWVLPIRVNGQADIRTFSPPIIQVELSGVEPLPAGVNPLMHYGGGGAGSGPQSPDAIRWITVPPDLTIPASTTAHFQACGYPSDGTILIAITAPSGNVTTAPNEIFDGCVEYYFGATYGMELGTYQITLKHPVKQLTYSWRVDYPDRPVVSTLKLDEQEILRALMGFAPNERLEIRFYSWDITPTTSTGVANNFGTYIATRTIEADKEGNAVLSIRVTRSANFNAWGIGLKIDGYTNSYSFPEDDPVKTDCDSRLGINQAFDGKYCVSPTLPSNMYWGGWAVVNAADGVNLYEERNTKSQLFEKLPNGAKVVILDKSSDSKDKSIEWRGVRSENGNFGWVIAKRDGVEFLSPYAGS